MANFDHHQYSSLQRSPSLMSRSSGASTPPPTTPSLSSSSSSHQAHSIDEHGAKLPPSSSISSHRNHVNAAIPRSNTARAYLAGTLNGQQPPPPTSAAHEKGIFAYQSKYLSRTASVQSLSSVTSPNTGSISNQASLPRLPTLQSINSIKPSGVSPTLPSEGGPNGSLTSRAAKRTTWAPGHRLPGSGSVSSVDDIMGRFGGNGKTGSTYPHSSDLPSSSSTSRSATPTFVSSSIPSSYSNYGGVRSNSPTKMAHSQSHSHSHSFSTPPLSASGLSSTSQAKINDSTPSSATSWKSSLARTSTQKSDSENVAPFPSSASTTSNITPGNASSYTGALPSSASRRFNSTPSSPASYTAPSSHSSRPLSPTLYGTSSSNLRNITTSPPPTSSYGTSSSNAPHHAPLESEIMRSTLSNNGAGTMGHRPKSSSFHLGSVGDLGHSSVGMLRNFRDYAVQDASSSSASSSAGRDSPSTSSATSGLARKFTVSGGGGASSSASSASSRMHRRTQTLPSLGDVGALASSSPSSITERGIRERHNSSGAADNLDVNSYPRSSSRYAGQNGTKLNMHGLDRLSERSDTSLNDEDDPTSSSTTTLGMGRPGGTPTSARVGRRMASDAGEDETGAIVIPGITVGSDSVAGLSGRLRLARQPTQTKYGTLPSVTVKAMEVQRQCLQAYEYLCHVSEAKEWLVACLWNHPLSPSMVNTSPEFNIHSPNVGAMGGNSPMISDGAGDEDDPSGLSNKSVVELEEALRNGVALARLARAFMGEKAVPRIFTVSIVQTVTYQRKYTCLKMPCI